MVKNTMSSWSLRLKHQCLIVMEDGLVPSEENYPGAMSQCLNPYCSGQWSRTMLFHPILNQLAKS